MDRGFVVLPVDAVGSLPSVHSGVSTRSLRSRLNHRELAAQSPSARDSTTECSRLDHRGAALCHDPRVPAKENGPGIGFWIAMGLGAAAGAFALYLGAGLWLSAGVFIVVAVAMGLLLS